jgi:radical SAM protein with 4Fe4S-binding SPASM domain
MMNLEMPDDVSLKQLQKLDIDNKQAHTLIHESVRMGTRSFIFSGGEPFLHTECLELIQRVKYTGSTCLVKTNGTLLDPSVIDELIKTGLDELMITTMAGTSEMYVRTHKGSQDDVFLKLRDTLLYIAERKEALGIKNPKISLVFILIKQNSAGIMSFAEFAARTGADRVLFRPIDDVEDSGLAKMVPTKEQSIAMRQQLSEAQKYLASQGIAHNIDFTLKVFGRQLDTKELFNLIPCYYGWLSLRIEADGMVYPCCRCYEPLGNIYEQQLKAIWTGDAYKQFRKAARKINRRKSQAMGCDCNSCTHFTANLRVYKYLHPLKGRSKRIEQLCPSGLKEGG